MGRDISRDEIEAKVAEHIKQWPSRKFTVEIEYVDTNDVAEVFGICLKSVKITSHEDQKNGEALACYAALAGVAARIVSDTLCTIEQPAGLIEMITAVKEFTSLTAENVPGILDIQTYKGGF